MVAEWSSKAEACNNGTTNDCDLDEPYGTALGYEYIYHFWSMASAYVVWLTITFGAYIFAFIWGSVTEPEECKTWDKMSASDKSQALNLVNSITTLEKCKEVLP